MFCVDEATLLIQAKYKATIVKVQTIAIWCTFHQIAKFKKSKIYNASFYKITIVILYVKSWSVVKKCTSYVK